MIVSSSTSSGAPMRRFSRSDVANSIGSSATTRTERRSSAGSASSSSRPSSNAVPRFGISRPEATAAMVDLPEPGEPVTTTIAPGGTLTPKSSSTRRCPRSTPMPRSSSPDDGAGAMRPSVIGRAPSASISAMRSCAPRRYCHALANSSKLAEIIASAVQIWNASRNVPRLRLPDAMRCAPSASTAAWMMKGASLSGDVVPSEEPNPGHREAVRLLGDRVHLGALGVFAAERLHDADAAHGLVDGAHHFGALVELGPREAAEAHAEAADQPEVQRHRGQREDAHRRAQDDDQDPEREEQRQVRDDRGEDEQELLDEREVGERSGDELTTRPPRRAGGGRRTGCGCRARPGGRTRAGTRCAAATSCPRAR